MIKFLFLFLLFSKSVFANKIVDIKTIDRDNYIRILFETSEKPIYFVKELEKGKVEIILPNTIIGSPLHKKIDKLNVIEDILLFTEDNKSRFVILTNNKNSLKRYLYTKPDKTNNFFRVIIDIEKINSPKYTINNNGRTNNSLDDLLLSKNIINNNYIYNNISENKDLDTLLNDLPLNNNFDSVVDLINNNDIFEINSIDDILSVNNINAEDIKNLEKQNNDDFDLNSFINKLDFSNDDKNYYSKKNKLYKEEEKNIKKQFKNIKISKNENEKFIVVLDAGHGGKDSGAVGRRGLKEKDVNLAFVKMIQKKLSVYNNIQVYLTRNNDYFLGLTDRVRSSIKLKADLFISIHSDSNKNTDSRGLSIYTLNDKGFNLRALRILKVQNTTFNYYANRNTLIKNARNLSINESIYFSNNLINAFNKNEIKMIREPLKRANFAILISPNYPSLLIELGFLSNYKDEEMLASLTYRNNLSDIIANQIKIFANKKKGS